jgi:hypothetical protein
MIASFRIVSNSSFINRFTVRHTYDLNYKHKYEGESVHGSQMDTV